MDKEQLKAGIAQLEIEMHEIAQQMKFTQNNAEHRDLVNQHYDLRNRRNKLRNQLLKIAKQDYQQKSLQR